MPPLDAPHVREVLAQVRAMVKSLSTSWVAKGTLVIAAEQALKDAEKALPLVGSGDLDPQKWNALAPDAREAAFQPLMKLHAELTVVIGDEPLDPNSVMFKTHASNGMIWFLTLLSLAATVLILICIGDRWADAVPKSVVSADVRRDTQRVRTGTSDVSRQGTQQQQPSSRDNPPSAAPRQAGDSGKQKPAGSEAPAQPPKTEGDQTSAAGGESKPASADARHGASATPGSGPDEDAVIVMVMLMGALGGLIHTLSSLGMFIGGRMLFRSWIVYYVIMPFEGAGLAAVIYMLLRVGILSPGAQATGTSNLNVIGLYAFAGLTGLFARQAIEMLADVFGRIFKKVEARDPLPKDKRT